MTTTDQQLTHFRMDVDADGVATIVMDRAGEPVNSLSPEVGADLAKILDRLETDPEIRAVVITSAKKDNFLAGADIKWLADLTDAEVAKAAVRAGQEGFARLERLHTELGKPVVAAIHGAALGGGLELALACSMRIASDDEEKTQLGQPEVQLGILPAAGGTQRLPKIVGIATALQMILTGKPVRPRKALKIGLVDEVCPKEVLAEVARRRALEALEPGPEASQAGLDRIKSWLSPSHLQQLALEENPVGRRVLFQKAEEQMLAETKGNYPAPKAALEVVRIGVEEGPDAGYRAEVEAFGRLVALPETKALISIFLGSNALKRDLGTDADVEPRTVRRAGVVGGGLMGSGIASVDAVKAKVPTRVKEIDPEGVARALKYVRKVVDGRLRKRIFTPYEADRRMRLVTGTTDYSGFRALDLVIEAVFEDLDVKHQVIQEVEGVTRDDAIFASNTSSIPISRLAAKSSRPDRVIGMHYFSPVEKMPLLEVIVTPQTDPEVIATAVTFGRKQGKTVVVVNDGPGFYTTRILGPYSNEVGYLLADGARIEDIDAAMVEWGFPVGPVTLADEVGIDVGAKISKVMQDAFGDRMRPVAGFERLVADGRKGRKNERGFYRYENGKRVGVDETVYDVLGLGPRREVPRQEIQDRISLAMINEAVRCLEEGILRSARDGDLAAVYGLGFPPFRGGPFLHIDIVGADHVVARLDELTAAHGDRFQPAPLLRKHADEGLRFRPEVVLP